MRARRARRDVERDGRDEKNRAEGIERGAKGRVVAESAEAFQLRESGVSYLADFGPKNDDIGEKSGYFWKNNIEISMR